MSPTINDFKKAALLGTCLSRDYAAEALRLLALYRSLSASELASRLDLHIQTAQDFLETLAELGIAVKEEVFEKKRPYFRYTLADAHIRLEIDLRATFSQSPGAKVMTGKIRERKNAGARFAAGRDNASISHVTVWMGNGRERRERRVNLTRDQGRFLFYLPFPTAEPESINKIMRQAGVDESSTAEIADLVTWLEENAVIERLNDK